MGKDYYKILGVTADADASTIKKVFRQLAKKYHPDTNSGNPECEQRFREINEAYSVLGDEEKRKEYDNNRAKGSANSSTAGNQKEKTTGKTGNPFAGFSAQNFKMDFGDMMFEEINNKKKKNENQGEINFADVSSQFASFFGFKPK